jgi:putative copper resistance protein D
MVAGAAGMSHAVAQLHGRAPLAALTASHQIAAAVWVGGLVHLLVTAFKGESPVSVESLQRFSTVALVSVLALAASGVALAAVYVASPAALLGTAYGFMVVTKTVILGGLVALGAANHRGVRRLAAGRAVMPSPLRQFLEVEIGLGITVLFVAASLTSTPPARDVVVDRATVAEVATIFTPQWPRLTSPTHEELARAGALGDRTDPRTWEDTAWSEYNHHVAGVFVFSLGLLALLAKTSWGSWARHWPLLLLGLAAFLFVRDDPETWPLGPIGFWESMTDVEVVQHRLFVLLLTLFGLFEWMVRTGRLRAARWAYVFPMICAAGGALLLTHSHAVSNAKTEFLMEVTHTPLALLGLVAGWARWLELRLPRSLAAMPERVWSVALLLVGVLLLMYREG